MTEERHECRFEVRCVTRHGTRTENVGGQNVSFPVCWDDCSSVCSCGARGAEWSTPERRC